MKMRLLIRHDHHLLKLKSFNNTNKHNQTDKNLLYFLLTPVICHDKMFGVRMSAAHVRCTRCILSFFNDEKYGNTGLCLQRAHVCMWLTSSVQNTL